MSDYRTHRITITNFCLGKHLVSEEDLLKDQRGSPAYISPDVLSGELKAQLFFLGRLINNLFSDMWRLHHPLSLTIEQQLCVCRCENLSHSHSFSTIRDEILNCINY